MARRSMWKTVTLLVAGGYAGLLGLGRLTYRAVLYPAPRDGLEHAPAGAELRHFVAADGVPVQALHYRAGPGSRTVVFFHGNGETIAGSIGLAQALTARGLGFVAVEYRGYGGSAGVADGPSEQGLYGDAAAVLEGLGAEGLAKDDLVLWGSSLGSGVAVEMVVRGHGSRLILSMPYTSIPAAAQRAVPILPMSWLMADRFDNLAKASRITLPTLILHGDRDRIVPYDMGVTLSQSIPGATLLTVVGGDHNDLFVREPDRLLDAIEGHAKGVP